MEDKKQQFIPGPYIQNQLLCGYCNGNGMDAGIEVCKPCRGSGIEAIDFFDISDVRILMSGDSDFAILNYLNKKATKFMYEWVKDKVMAREKLIQDNQPSKSSFSKAGT